MGALSLCAQCVWQALCGCSYGEAYAYSGCIMHSWATYLYTASQAVAHCQAQSSYQRRGASAPQAAGLPRSLVGWQPQQHHELDRQHRRRLSSTQHPAPRYPFLSLLGSTRRILFFLGPLRLAVRCAATLRTSHLLSRLPSQGWTSLPISRLRIHRYMSAACRASSGRLL